MNKQLRDKRKRDTKKTGWKWFNLISLGVTAAVLVGVVVGNRGVGGLLGRWGSLDLGWMVASLACMVGYWVLEAMALHMLIGCLYSGVPFRSNMRTAMIGQLYNALTPFASGGEPVQLIYMQRDGLDAGGAASVLTIKAIAYQVGMMLIALFAIFSSYNLFHDKVPAFGWMAAGGFTITMMVALVMLLLALSPRITRTLYSGVVKALHAVHIVRDVHSMSEKVKDQVDIYHESTHRFDKKRRVVAGMVVVTCVQLCLIYLVPYTIYRAFGYRGVSALTNLSAVAFVSMVSAVVPLPGGSGGAEGSFVLFFSLFFFEGDLLAALLLWRIITYYSGMVVGALIMMVSRKRQRACIRLPL